MSTSMDRVQTATSTNSTDKSNKPRFVASEPRTWLPWLQEHLNFFRIHLLVFTFLPLIASVIIWGRIRITRSNMSMLFICLIVLSQVLSIDLSHTTPFQQFLLWLLMFIGSPIVVSWIMVIVRKWNTLATQCAHYAAEQRGITSVTKAAVTAVIPRFLSRTKKEEVYRADLEEGEKKHLNLERSTTTGMLKPFRGISIRRVDTELKKVDPSGRISREATSKTPPEIFFEPNEEQATSPPSLMDSPRPTSERLHEETNNNLDARTDDSHHNSSHGPSPLAQHLESPGLGLTTSSPTPTGSPGRSARAVGFDIPASTSVATAPNGMSRVGTLRQRHNTLGDGLQRSQTYTEIDIRPKKNPLRPVDSYYLPAINERYISKHSIGFGGFPGPIEILRGIYHWILSKLPDRNQGHLLRPYPSRLLPTGHGTPGQLARYDTKEVPYLSFSAVVGKNSTFHGLTERELDELGGVEYRGLRMLSYMVPLIYVCVQALGWLVNGILMSKQEYHSVFTSQWKYVQPAWAGVFQATSATTNAGMSLVDTGLVHFQREPGILLVTSFESLTGNTAFPIFLRFIIWIGTSVASSTGQARATLHFLLDHPRRCFLYLFPSHQTWFLLIILFILNMIDWSGFLLLDIGNQTLDQIPLGWRVLNGWLQATSVRCAGVASVNISILAPAAQVLFVIMMYVAPYPVALAVRSTNVYQDRSLGVYEEEDSDDDESEQEVKYEHDKRAKPVVWGSYLAWHAKRQLAYDIWWIAGAWLLVAIFERAKIWDPATKQFDLFGILFELVSAYGSVGLSLGLSNANYSLSGAWTPASKVTLCIVMVRGRSRGLPVAIDRAVMLPTEFSRVSTRPDPDPAIPTQDVTHGTQESEKRQTPVP